MRKVYFLLPAALCALALVGPVAPSSADENPLGRCPDGYTPVPFLVAPAEDGNGNGVVCTKVYPQGVITHDDPQGQPYRCNGTTPPPECIMFVVDDLLP
ncbi:MAG TPA: hypothetical protein VF520_04970 [Thermoleophilaceae bacterium]|jgi:hypothetical protein